MLDRQGASWATTTPPDHASDGAFFLRAWLQAPLRTGAQAPSSRYLARAMAAAVDPALPGKVIELGPGTGAVTRALVERGVDPARLVLVEANTEFCGLLRARHPDALILPHDAYAAPRLLRRMGIGPVAANISGLPLLTQAPARRQRLLLECLQMGARRAPFVQFTYLYRSPIPLRPGVVATDVSPIIWRNLWPARVWSYRLPAGWATKASSGSAGLWTVSLFPGSSTTGWSASRF